VATRRMFISMVEDVQRSGGKVHIFSSQHMTGEELAKISGVAATLRFPMFDEDGDEEEAEGAAADSRDAAASSRDSTCDSFTELTIETMSTEVPISDEEIYALAEQALGLQQKA